jgi:hypothetical protein
MRSKNMRCQAGNDVIGTVYFAHFETLARRTEPDLLLVLIIVGTRVWNGRHFGSAGFAIRKFADCSKVDIKTIDVLIKNIF